MDKNAQNLKIKYFLKRIYEDHFFTSKLGIYIKSIYNYEQYFCLFLQLNLFQYLFLHIELLDSVFWISCTIFNFAIIIVSDLIDITF